MEKLFNGLMIAFIIVLLSGVYFIKKYENLYEENMTKSAIYFQNPSRTLLKVTSLFDDGLFLIHKYEYHHKEKLIIKAKILFISAKNLLKQKSEYKPLLFIIDNILYKINSNQKINILKTSEIFHIEINKISFVEYKKSIMLFEKYKKDVKRVQMMLYLILLFITILMFAIFIIVHQSNILKKIKYLSETDQLTKAYNRRKFFEVIDNHKDIYSLIMFDIDHFKEINDTYGHDKGDYVLKTLIKIIRDNIRKDDMIFRWGGEEFFILFKNMTLEDAQKMAEKLRILVEKYDFNGLKITISMSVIASKHGKEIEKIIKELDIGLYEAKNRGRNQVVVKGII